jgi:2-polyprenyl-3-methyl-5-hydroxy-6-metoxy-1,4-benzoquinol methylase
MNTEFTPHEVFWTREKSSRIWTYFSSNRSLEHKYFSKQAGDSIIRFVQHHIDLSGDILDFGCGPGFLMEKLLNKKIPCQGLDFSKEAVQVVINKFNGDKNFKGVTLAENIPTALAADKFNIVFFIETIEHLLPDELIGTLQEIHRIARPAGYVIITTPNQENLEQQKIICPECGCIYHTFQHVSTWTKTDLSSLMENVGFKEVLCKTTKFRPKMRLNFLRDAWIKARQIEYPNLIYIGTKL